LIFIPAIDISHGACVRLQRGEFQRMVHYGVDPVMQARKYEEEGVERIHIVDMDAVRGMGDNRTVIKRIRREVSCVLQVGGGIRSDKTVRELLDIGIDYLVVGTVFVESPTMVKEWIQKYGKHFLAGMDIHHGQVRVRGWQEDAGQQGSVFSQVIRQTSVSAVVCTVIERDGMLKGPDINMTNRIAIEVQMPVILSGGVSSLQDIQYVMIHGHAAVKGIIVGKALYEKKFSVREAVELCQGK